MKVLVIGSSVCDVVMHLEVLPQVRGDENIISQARHMGGCAFNVANVLKQYEVPFDLLSPVGIGIFGDFVREEFNKREIPILIESEEENGCCYCIVDKDKDRTFLSDRGCEYKFYPEYFENLNPDDYDYVYVCGLELEEDTADNIVTFLEDNDFDNIIFAPSTRINHIPDEIMKRMFALNPIIHLNEDEILAYTHLHTIEASAIMLHEFTNNTIIVTLGAAGCFYYDGVSEYFVDAYHTKVVDTIGAGDTHAGTVIAMLYKEHNMEEAIDEANKNASKVVEHEGAS